MIRMLPDRNDLVVSLLASVMNSCSSSIGEHFIGIEVPNFPQSTCLTLNTKPRILSNALTGNLEQPKAELSRNPLASV
jgi:hypothetical protein